MSKYWMIFFLIGASVFGAQAQEAEDWIQSVAMSPDALQLVMDFPAQVRPLSFLGRKAVLARFALFYQEKIVEPQAKKVYQECKESETSRDCEKEYMALYQAEKKRNEYKITVINI